jgi:hypothetical protein
MDIATQQTITVQFIRGGRPKFTFIPAGNIVISKPGIEQVSFNLSAPGHRTRFSANPIQFRNDQGQPIAQPSGTSFTIVTQKIVTVTVNTAQVPDKICFSLIVQTRDGVSFDSDPTIVTMLPPGGGQMP